MVNWDKVCVINVAVGRGHESGQIRLKASLEATGYKGHTLFWKGKLPKDSPTHQEMPYAFKTFAFKEAINKGFEIIFWLDASVWANKDIAPLIEKIETDGYFIPDSGWKVGQWSSDNALNYFGITRQEAFEMKLITAGIMGLKINNQKAIDYFKKWIDSIETFKVEDTLAYV